MNNRCYFTPPVAAKDHLQARYRLVQVMLDQTQDVEFIQSQRLDAIGCASLEDILPSDIE